jgi:uncharacterized protein
MRIGLIADTHDEVVPWDAVHAKIAEAFGGTELILHCGDLTTIAVLDRLAEIAPVIAVRSAIDPVATPPRLLDGPQVVEAGGVAIGIVNTLVGEEPAFGREVAVIVHGGTHESSVETRGDVLYVNPGSPTLSDRTSVAVVELGDGPATATIVPIGD